MAEIFTLSDFYLMEVIRNENNVAEIIADYDKDRRPVRLIGFTSDAGKSDLEIREEGFHYYNLLLQELNII